MQFPSSYELTPGEVIAARLKRLGELCGELSLDGILLTHPNDLWYASGTAQQGAMLIDARGKALVFMRRNVRRATAECPLPVEPITSLSTVASAVKDHLGASARLGLTLDVMNVAAWQGWQKRLAPLELADASAGLLKLKAVKDQWELDKMAAAGRLAAWLYDQAGEMMAPGVSELHIAAELCALGLERGSIPMITVRGDSFAYSWHLVSGPEGATPSVIDAPFGGYGLSPAFPQGPFNKPLRPGEPIIVDLGVSQCGYQTDQTRTYCLGPAPDALHKAHDCLAAVEDALLGALRPGAVSGELFDLAVEVAAEHGMSDGFLGKPEQRIRFVGHGVGSELGAPPYLLQGSPEKARAFETYALELKIVLDEGPVGLENTLVVNPEGPPTIISDMPNHLREIPI